jgi:hypothetical protein
VGDHAFIESGARVDVIPDRSAYSSSFILRFHDAATMRLVAEWSEYSYYLSNIPIPNLRPGTYRLYVDFIPHGYSNWAPQWFDRTSDPSQARTITIGSGQVVDIPITADGARFPGMFSAQAAKRSRRTSM